MDRIAFTFVLTCRDALIVSLGNCLTSFFAGFVIFSFLGYLASELDVEVDEVVQSGTYVTSVHICVLRTTGSM